LPGSEFIAASSLYRTAPVGLKRQPDFINAVVELVAVSPAPTLLDMLFAIEARFGRQRSVRNAPRTLDLDLLLYGDELSADPVLTLPHPRLHERAFVLAPLAELAPQLVIPGRGPVSDLLAHCAGQKHRKMLVAPEWHRLSDAMAALSPNPSPVAGRLRCWVPVVSRPWCCSRHRMSS
jgi:2-amino-4-hydroxy-6-hydroxymethyldihydropteridine diphosphokinase